VLSNGAVLSRVGSAAVALMAAAQRVPGEGGARLATPRLRLPGGSSARAAAAAARGARQPSVWRRGLGQRPAGQHLCVVKQGERLNVRMSAWL
jgi:hypothetical protein